MFHASKAFRSKLEVAYQKYLGKGTAFKKYL